MIVRHLIFAALALAGCHRSNEVSTTTTTSAAYTPTHEEAALWLTNARCDRAAECFDVGTDYADRAECTAVVGRSTRTTLGACRGDVNAAELETCVARIRGEPCNHPRDTLDRIAACRRLCR
ncbi:MAG: hypothetical protein KIT84_21385 [Labilithrix sp.]|nr:hypothetical protein [Labilithrix sp.]MCW5813597.1 hypothetical protein [Labilithrix sp.]